jgi:hypothetical protein
MTPPPSPLAKQDERYRCYTMPFSTTVPYKQIYYNISQVMK